MGRKDRLVDLSKGYVLIQANPPDLVYNPVNLATPISKRTYGLVATQDKDMSQHLLIFGREVFDG